MIGIFCADKHHTGKGLLCRECRELLEYAFMRLDKCPFGADKGPCAKCPIHCYKPRMRDRVRAVMAYAGKHLIDGRRGKFKKETGEH